MGRTLFKKVCRREGIEQWPQQRITPKDEVSEPLNHHVAYAYANMSVWIWYPHRPRYCRSRNMPTRRPMPK